MKTLTVILASMLLLISGFMSGYGFRQPEIIEVIKVAERVVIVDRWHEPEAPELIIVETVRYEPLPREYVEAAIAGVEQAKLSHQLYMDRNPDLTEGVIAFHQKTMDKYDVSLVALESLLIE